MPRSTITSKRQTTIPKEVCDALDVGPGDQITWEVNGGRVAVTTDRPGLWRWKGLIATRHLPMAPRLRTLAESLPRPRRCVDRRRRHHAPIRRPRDFDQKLAKRAKDIDVVSFW